jgi:DNA polymerase-3 subunit gamma/tau
MAPETIREHLTNGAGGRTGGADLQALRCWRVPRAARCAMPCQSDRPGDRLWLGPAAAEAAVRQMLGSVDRSYVFRLIEALASGRRQDRGGNLEALRLNGLSAASTLEEMVAGAAAHGGAAGRTVHGD